MRRLTFAAAFASIVFSATASLAQSYGDQDQTLTIGAAEFESVAAALDDFIDADGYDYGPDPDVYYAFRAPLNLPEGAVIEQICLFANDSDPQRVAGTYLSAVKLVPGGGSPHAVGVPNSGVTSSSDVGYGYYCTNGLSYALRSTFDIDNDGVPDHVSYEVSAYLSNVFAPSTATLGFGGVRITWKRVVSPLSLPPVFGDVPDGDASRRFIEALAASGITAGCGGGNFCPDATLTRRQMAVFLAKALGLHWSN